jgi:dihydroorotate dehydrogenase (NAD+) catalytic subunit
MIELAPAHKYGLLLPTPVMPAAGAFGYGDAYRDLVESNMLGAIVTNPVSLRPRTAARGQRIAVRGEHFVVHTGLPNPGVKAVIRQSAVPIIPHLIATTPGEASKAAVQLSAARGVGGIELGLAENTSEEKAVNLLHAAQEGSGLPIIVRVPFDRVEALAPLLVEAGAEALTLTAPPRAVLPIADETPKEEARETRAGETRTGETRDGETARFIRGRLYGPALFPLLLDTLARWATPGPNQLHVPIIACGGIASPEDALACISLGATAVQVDAQLWRNPALLAQVANGFRETENQDSRFSDP